MQALTKEGSRVVLGAIDTDGLDATVPVPINWVATGDFNVIVADDGLSAAVIPGGTTSTGKLTATAGNLALSEDISFTSDDTGDTHQAVKLTFTFTPIAPAPAPAPAP